jgi:hypothetical protein
MKIIRGLTGAGALLAGVVLAAACGSNSGSGQAAGHRLGAEYPAIKAAALRAHSVRMAGHLVQDGKAESVDLALVKPSSVAGSIAEAGTTYLIVVTPAQTYVGISKQLLQKGHLPAGLCAKVCGKYLEIASSASVFADFSMGNLIKTVFDKPLSSAEAAIVLLPGTFRGHPVWRGTGTGETFSVSRGGTPYLLSVSKQGQAVTFTDWNTATVSAPPAGQVLTATQLGALAAGG